MSEVSEKQGSFYSQLDQFYTAQEESRLADKKVRSTYRRLEKLIVSRFRERVNLFADVANRAELLGYSVPMLDVSGLEHLPYLDTYDMQDIGIVNVKGEDILKFRIEDSRYTIPVRYLNPDGVEAMQKDVTRLEKHLDGLLSHLRMG